MREYSKTSMNHKLSTKLIQHSNDAILCLSNKFDILDINPVLEKIYSWNKNDVLKKNYFELCSLTKIIPVTNDPSELLACKNNCKFGQYIDLAKGEKHHIVWSINCIYDSSKIPIILLIGQDISKEKQLEQQRDVAEIFLESIIAQIPEYVFWKNKDAVYLGCNDLLAKAAGLKSRSEIVGKTDNDFGWDPDRVKRLAKIDKEVITTGKIKTIEELIPLPSDGSNRTMLTYKAPLRDKEQEIIGVLGISVDITDRKLAEETLEQAKKAAEIANEAKTQFIQNMEHDIRTPASGVSEMAQQIATREKNPKKQATLKCLAGSAKQLLDLLNNILAFDHIESGDIPILAKKFNLQVLLDDLISLEASAAQLKNLSLILDTTDSLPKELIGDDHRLKRILINLLSNSIKFTEKGNITLKAESINTDDNKICLLIISVKDTGIGISARDQSLIYEKFTHVAPSNKGLHKGMGLGLNIVKQFLGDLDGEIEVESTVGKGTEFTCTIPFKLPLTERFTIKANSEGFSTDPKPKCVKRKLQQQPATKNEVTPKNATVAEKPKLTILLVEDNELAQMIAATMLEEDMDIKVDVASTGKEALQHATNNQYDLIFMDIGLPDTDGYKVTREIRSGENKNSVTPIVALTAHRIDTAGDDASAAGMNDFLTKPLNIEKTQKILDKLVYQKVKSSFGEEAKSEKKLDKKKNNDTLSLALATKIIGKTDTAKNMIKMFIDIIPEHKEELSDTFEKKDYLLLADVSHKIIGITAYIGTPTLKRLLTDLKLACLDKKTTKIKTVLTKVYKEFDKIIAVYKRTHNAW